MLKPRSGSVPRQADDGNPQRRTYPTLVLTCAFFTAAATLPSGCVPLPQQRPIVPGPAPHSARLGLWHIVHDRCIPGQIASKEPTPCEALSIANGIEQGYAVLKDRVGIGQYLLMPTILITGIEDPRLLAADAPNYFDDAWRIRQRVATRARLSLQRDDIGIAVNSVYGRTQDLLHLRVDCLRTDVRDALRHAAPFLDRHWSRRTLTLAGHRYYAVRVDGDETIATNPFQLLSSKLHVPAADMGAWTIVMTGAYFPRQPGFILLAARASLESGDVASGEMLQDHDCMGRVA
ncbi:MAG: CDP-diacylglycerol diphosphatase [Pseudomonadota bacterium]